MAKAILMSIPLVALFAGAADATVIYNWRHQATIQGDEIITGQIRFSYKAWLARRAEVDFEAVLVPFPGSGTPENPPRFLYPYGQDVVGLSFNILGPAFPPINLVQGSNRAYLESSGFGLFADIAFTEDRQLFGSISASYRSVAGASFIGGNFMDWRASASSDGACSITCLTTGFWELDPATDPRLVPEPGGLALILAGVLGVGLMAGRPAQPRPRRRDRDRRPQLEAPSGGKRPAL